MSEKRIKNKVINIEQKEGTFSTIFKRFKKNTAQTSSDLALLRGVLSNEKARILHVLKTKQPNSIYELAKILSRDFKAVRQDVIFLEKAGFIEMIPVHKGKRQKLKPLLVVDVVKININL
jgi:predicted transcriptional regulator